MSSIRRATPGAMALSMKPAKPFTSKGSPKMDVEKIISRIPAMSSAERKDLQENGERLIQEGTSEQKDAAQRVIAAIAAQEAAEHATLLPRLSGMDAGERVVAAFRALPPTDVDRTVMKALLDNPGKTS